MTSFQIWAVQKNVFSLVRDLRSRSSYFPSKTCLKPDRCVWTILLKVYLFMFSGHSFILRFSYANFHISRNGQTTLFKLEFVSVFQIIMGNFFSFSSYLPSNEDFESATRPPTPPPEGPTPAPIDTIPEPEPELPISILSDVVPNAPIECPAPGDFNFLQLSLAIGVWGFIHVQCNLRACMLFYGFLV